MLFQPLPFAVYSASDLQVQPHPAFCSIDEYLRKNDLFPNWFAVISELAGNCRFCSPTELSHFSYHASVSGKYVFKDGSFSVKCTSQSEWRSVIKEMEMEGVIHIADDSLSCHYNSMYEETGAALAPVAFPLPGDVVLSRDGYSHWNKYIVSFLDFGFLQKTLSGSCNEWMLVQPSHLSFDQSCPMESYPFPYEECKRKSVKDGLCQVDSIGSYWADNYSIYQDGHALRCFRSLQQFGHMLDTLRLD
jgi:hypothetical protein